MLQFVAPPPPVLENKLEPGQEAIGFVIIFMQLHGQVPYRGPDEM